MLKATHSDPSKFNPKISHLFLAWGWGQLNYMGLTVLGTNKTILLLCREILKLQRVYTSARRRLKKVLRPVVRSPRGAAQHTIHPT